MRRALPCFLVALASCGVGTRVCDPASCDGADGGGGDAGLTPDAGGADGGPGGNDAGTVDSGGTDAGGRSDAGGNPSCAGSVPLVYNAPTDRLPHPATAPSLGPAGTVYTDPTYGTRVLRLTDVNTNPGTNLSYKVANEFWGNDWNTDSTLFYIQASSSGLLPFSFDPRTLTATRVMDKAQPTKPFAMPIQSGGFSRLQPNLFIGMKGLTVSQLDFTTQAVTPLVDLHSFVADAGGYVLGIEQGANGMLATSFGGPQQDKMPYVATWSPATGVHHVVDTYASTLDGIPLGAAIDGGVHTIKIDKSGRYVSFAVSGGALTNWLWDTSTNTVASVPGTGTLGWGAFVHRGTGDAYQWDVTNLSTPTQSTPLISPLLTPTDNLASSSLDWMNAAPGALAPVIVDTMRQPADTGPWRAWDEEVIAVSTDGTSQVWRFAHTFNTYAGTIYSDNFYYLFIPRVSQNGWFALFDSNWNQTLGTDAQGNPRTDVFVAALGNPCGP